MVGHVCRLGYIGLCIYSDFDVPTNVNIIKHMHMLMNDGYIQRVFNEGW